MAWFRFTLFSLVLCSFLYARHEHAKLFIVNVEADTSEERTKIADLGIALDGIFSDSITFFGTKEEIAKVKQLGFKVDYSQLPTEFLDDFPPKDSEYHNYQETMDALDLLAVKHPNLVTKIDVGKSLEERNLVGVRISANPEADSLPTAIYVGCHHAREHLSVEIPIKLAQYLAENFEKDARVKELLETREVYIIPMLNPDGAEYDISGSSYKWWRKNRRKNDGGSYGVDLNRNYAKGFGGQGASSNPTSDTYHGPEAFSEPETAALRDFVRARKKATVLISYHTFSELVLWPWGHTNDEIADNTDRTVFETIGEKMASFNGYKPQKSSDLYVASGDTTDWAYDELGIFAFTFELSPSSIFGGGFYPGADAIEPTFEENIEPALYLLEQAADPYAVLDPRVVDPLGIL